MGRQHGFREFFSFSAHSDRVVARVSGSSLHHDFSFPGLRSAQPLLISNPNTFSGSAFNFSHVGFFAVRQLSFNPTTFQVEATKWHLLLAFDTYGFYCVHFKLLISM
jgi:hypothetical protein